MNNFTVVSICEANRNIYQNSKSYEDKAIRLARSIRSSGSKCPITMWYGKDKPPSDITAIRLMGLGCDLVGGDCIYPEHPLFNKVEALSTVKVNTESLLWVDTDVYIKNSIDDLKIISTDIAATADVYSHHALTTLDETDIWKDYYRLADVGLERLHQRYALTSIDNKIGNFYMNTGVFLMANNPSLRDMYKNFSSKVLESDFKYSKNYYDAIGLTLTVLKSSCSFQFIQETYNYYYALRRNIDGNFIHYQDNELGDLLPEWDV